MALAVKREAKELPDELPEKTERRMLNTSVPAYQQNTAQTSRLPSLFLSAQQAKVASRNKLK
eukprot:6463346-Amphidinium_carterae.1